MAFGHYRHVLSVVFEELVRSLYFDAARVLRAHADDEDGSAAAAAKEALKVRPLRGRPTTHTPSPHARLTAHTHAHVATSRPPPSPRDPSAGTAPAGAAVL